MDFVTAIEADVSLPIAFDSRSALNKWVGANDLKFSAIGKRRKAVRICGRVHGFGPDANIGYNQIWVAAKYFGYRDAVKVQLKASEGSLKDIHFYDGDHAVSRTRLTKIWPDAWVNLVLVESSVNRAVGSMMEKEPLDVTSDDVRIDINAECILKTFLRKSGSLSRTDLATYLRECRDRFVKLAKGESGSTTKEALELVERFTMGQNADNFFAQIAEDLEIDPAHVLPSRRIVVVS